MFLFNSLTIFKQIFPDNISNFRNNQIFSSTMQPSQNQQLVTMQYPQGNVFIPGQTQLVAYPAEKTKYQQFQVMDQQRLCNLLKDRDVEIDKLKLRLNQFQLEKQEIQLELNSLQQKFISMVELQELKEQEIREWRQKFVELKNKQSKLIKVKSQLMKIVLLAIENERLHQVLKDGLEENEMLRNFIKKEVSYEGQREKEIEIAKLKGIINDLRTQNTELREQFTNHNI